jgi:hypothetical protein
MSRRPAREVRVLIAGFLDLGAAALGKLADRVDPPRPPDHLIREEALQDAERRLARLEPQELRASRLRHPSTDPRPETLLGDMPGPVTQLDTGTPLLAPVVSLRSEGDPAPGTRHSTLGALDPLVGTRSEETGWIPCTLGAITATRPIGARVRFIDRKGYAVEGRIVALDGDDLPLVEYRLRVDTARHRDLSYVLPLSHPLEVNRDRT